MKVKILKKYVDSAKGHAFDRSNYYPGKVVHKVRFNNIIKGKIGEEVVMGLFRMEKIPHKADINEKGTPDRFDVKVKDILIEVKTISADTKYRNLIISKSSFDRGKQLDYYILVEIDKDWNIAEIIGYATKDDFFKKAKTKELGPRVVYSIGLKQLRSFPELLKLLKKA